MTTRQDAPMQRDEDINEKDQLLREGRQEPEDSLEYETKAYPFHYLKFSGREFFVVGEICNAPGVTQQ